MGTLVIGITALRVGDYRRRGFGLNAYQIPRSGTLMLVRRHVPTLHSNRSGRRDSIRLNGGFR